MPKIAQASSNFEIGKPRRLAAGRREFDTQREDMLQIGAISAFEGLYPTDSFASLRERYASGELSVQQFRKAVEARWKKDA